jgi:hypothetical protein
MWNLIYTVDLRIIYFMLDPAVVIPGTNHILEQFSGDDAGYALAKVRIQELGLFMDTKSLVSQSTGTATPAPVNVVESNPAIQCAREMAIATDATKILDQLKTNDQMLKQATERVKELGINDDDRNTLRLIMDTIGKLGGDDQGYAQIARIQELILPLMIKAFCVQNGIPLK